MATGSDAAHAEGDCGGDSVEDQQPEPADAVEGEGLVYGEGLSEMEDDEEEGEEEEGEEQGYEEEGEEGEEEDEDGLEAPLAEEVVQDADDPEVTYDFCLKPDDEYPYRLDFFGAYQRLGHRIATMAGSFIDRSIFRYQGGFFEACDAHSDELQEASITFCSDKGTARFHNIQGLENTDAAARGGFLNIEQVIVAPELRGSGQDIGIRLFRAGLAWLDKCHATADPTVPQWTLCVIKPSFLRSCGGPPEDHDAKVAAHHKICKQFARIGFQQAFPTSEFFYLTRDRLTLKSKEEMAGFVVTRAPAPPPKCDDDAPLVQAVLDFVAATAGRGSIEELAAQLKRMEEAVQAGACVNRSRALFQAIANCRVEEGAVRLDPAVDLVRKLVQLGGDVNYTDENGGTSLHIAAGRRNPGLVKELLLLGADPEARTLAGHTPLDEAKTAIQNSKDFCTTFSLGGILKAFGAALRPQEPTLDNDARVLQELSAKKRKLNPSA